MPVEARKFGIGKSALAVPGTVPITCPFTYDDPVPVEDVQDELIEGYIRPTGGITQTGPYEFVLPAANDGYLLLNKMKMECRAKIVKSDGKTDCSAAEDVVAPVNLIGSALFQHSEAYLNDALITNASSAHTNYKAYLETVLSAQHDKCSTLASQLWVMDTAGAGDKNNGVDNSGFKSLFGITKNSQTFDWITPLSLDLLGSPTNLAPGNKLTLKFYRAPDAFVLRTDGEEEYKLIILDMKLRYQRTRLVNMPQPNTERYLLTRTEVRKYPVPVNSPNYCFKLHYSGKMPRSVVLCQVLTAASEGSYKHNPWHFQHFSVNDVALRQNGRVLPPDRLRPVFKEEGTSLVAREYDWLLKNTGMDRMDRRNLISPDAFRRGHTIFAYDLTPDNCCGAHYHVTKSGDIDVEFGWEKPLEKAITIIAHMTFDEVYVNQKNENVVSVEQI